MNTRKPNPAAATRTPAIKAAQRFRPLEVVYPELERLLRNDVLRRRLTIAASTAGLLLCALGAFVFTRPPTGCAASPARRSALEKIAEYRDRANGEPLDRRFPRKGFHCDDVSSPTGVLVAARETEDAAPVIWWVDAKGTPHNVNMLALAFTPDFPTAPEIANAEIAKVQ